MRLYLRAHVGVTVISNFLTCKHHSRHDPTLITTRNQGLHLLVACFVSIFANYVALPLICFKEL